MAIVSLAQAAAPAAASPCGHSRFASLGGPRIVITKIRSGGSCGQSWLTIDYIGERHRHAWFKPGLSRYVLPRHGTDYQPGEDWRCWVRIRVRFSRLEQHEVLVMTGGCVYMDRSSTRFWFKSVGAYA